MSQEQSNSPDPEELKEIDNLQKSIQENPFKARELVHQFLGLTKDQITRQKAFLRKQALYNYYNATYGKQVKDLFDAMMEDGLDRAFSKKDYPTINLSTLYASINQGSMYLIENLDPDRIYKEFRRRIEIRRPRPKDDEFRIVFLHKEAILIKSRVVKTESSFDDVYRIIQEVIQTAPPNSKVSIPDEQTPPFHLKDEEILFLEQFLSKHEHITAIVSGDLIKMVIRKPEKAKERIQTQEEGLV